MNKIAIFLLDLYIIIRNLILDNAIQFRLVTILIKEYL